MHFVIGGAFHGKRTWVQQAYRLEEIPFIWLNCYEEKDVFQLSPQTSSKEDVIVIEGIESIVRQIVCNSQYDGKFIAKWLQPFLIWEQSAQQRKLIIIGTDTSKGVVPMEKQERFIRDEIGRSFQFIAKKAENVSVIWYGIQQEIK